MNIYFIKDIEPGADPEMEEGDALSEGCCVHSTLHYYLTISAMCYQSELQLDLSVLEYFKCNHNPRT